MSVPRNQIDYSGRGAVVDVTAAFGGVLLIVTAFFGVLQGIAAIADPDFFAAGSDYVFRFNVTAWGWIHLLLGLFTIAIGVAILKHVTWGQILGIAVAGLSALTNFAFLPHYPWWAVTIIAIDVLVIWALSSQLRGGR